MKRYRSKARRGKAGQGRAMSWMMMLIMRGAPQSRLAMARSYTKGSLRRRNMFRTNQTSAICLLG